MLYRKLAHSNISDFYGIIIVMKRFGKHWKRMPDDVRRPLTFIAGLFFVIAAGLTGWLPGPGGIPLFLIGIAIWATEFEWAKRFRDYFLRQFNKHKDTALQVGIIFFCLFVGTYVILLNNGTLSL